MRKSIEEIERELENEVKRVRMLEQMINIDAYDLYADKYKSTIVDFYTDLIDMRAEIYGRKERNDEAFKPGIERTLAEKESMDYAQAIYDRRYILKEMVMIDTILANFEKKFNIKGKV